jgi:ethanolamine utilization protein EutN
MPASSASSITGTSGDRDIAECGLRIADWDCGLPMQIARVIGTVVATQKHRKFEGAKLLLVQPLNLDDTPRGTALLAVDGVGAGVDEKVLVVLEGRAAGEALGKKAAPVDAAIIGIVDTVSMHE